MVVPMTSETKPKDSIEHHLRNKEEDFHSRAVPQIENEFRAKYTKQNEVLDKNFELPNTEFVVDHYSCAHYGKIPKQGRLYITPKYVLFFANILGKKVKKKIPFADIEEIKKESVTLLAMSPIEIQLKYKRFTFVSFVHRDKAFDNLLLQWKQNKEGRPYTIKIALEDEGEGGGHDEGEQASLSNNAADEPTSGGIQLQSLWGNSTTNGSTLEGENKKRRTGIISSMPKLYSSSSGNDSDKKRSCCSCLPWFN